MKIFISSVQREFAAERKALAKYIREDAIHGKFFEVFLFEEVPAQKRSASEVYLSEVDACDLYLGLHGESYGNVDRKGVLATEREYDRAETKGKPRICFRRRRHKSMPVNPLLARAMYMRGYIEHVGSGTGATSRSNLSRIPTENGPPRRRFTDRHCQKGYENDIILPCPTTERLSGWHRIISDTSRRRRRVRWGCCRVSWIVG